MYVKDEILWCVRKCGTMVDVSQVMIAHTITCQIHDSRHTTPLCNELIYSCSCTEILALLTMKLELLSPLLSDSPFLSSKVFCLSDFRIWLDCWMDKMKSCLLRTSKTFHFELFSGVSETRQFCCRWAILCRNEKFTKTFVKNLVRDPPSLFIMNQ